MTKENVKNKIPIRFRMQDLFDKKTENGLYQKALRGVKVQKFTPDVLLIAQQRHEDVVGHDLSPELFAPTLAQQELYDAYLSIKDTNDVRRAVEKYLLKTCPSLFETTEQ